jgi:F-type H+-transporting ATPase subunit b
MEEIVHAFGLDLRLIAIQMFNFVILAGLLWYFLYTPILKLLEEREAKLRQGVLDAEAAAEAKRGAEAEKQSILAGAQREASDIVVRAHQHGDADGRAIVEEAERRGQHIITEAKEKGEELVEKARKESEAEIARLAILATEKLLREKLDSK